MTLKPWTSEQMAYFDFYKERLAALFVNVTNPYTPRDGQYNFMEWEIDYIRQGWPK